MHYEDGFWWSKDELRLHYRHYKPAQNVPDAGLPILCLHGLTRNARDFHNIAEWLGARHEMLVPEMRGRGESGYAKDPMSYVPLCYVQDIERLLDKMGWKQFIVIGTSMGGILAMILASLGSARMAGAVINDIGPVISPEGLERIKSTSGRGAAHDTWMHAARHIMSLHTGLYPNWQIQDWIAQAKRTHRLTESGKIVLDYDARIFEPLAVPGAAAGVDLQQAWRALADIPLALIRGELSDLLSPQAAGAAVTALNKAQLITVPHVGHAPTLDEPESRAAISALIKQAEARQCA